MLAADVAAWAERVLGVGEWRVEKERENDGGGV